MRLPLPLFSFSRRGQRRAARSRRAGGFTVIEILITSAITLLIAIAVINAFLAVSKRVTHSRAILEMSGRLRGVTQRMRLDLDGVTVPVRPWPHPSSGLGYFEYVEGSMSQLDTNGDGQPDIRDLSSPSDGILDIPPGLDTTIGDLDDIIMFTSRSDGEPFVGRFNGNTIQSQVAEIIWWTHFNVRDDRNGNNRWDPGEMLTLHRRVLLVRPDLGILGAANFATFYADNDVSVRFAGGNLVANSLADLTKRENRFAHNNAAFPHRINYALLNSLVLAGNHEGEDVILSDVLAFDVQLYDPSAVVRANPQGNPMVPSDPGYPAADANTPVVGWGTYVDLNYAGSGSGIFSGVPHPKSQLAPMVNHNHPWMPPKPSVNPTPPPWTSVSYCTWSFHYEKDGVNQDGDGDEGNFADGIDNDGDNLVNEFIDEATNSLDDDNNGGADDFGERETLPPYPFPVRGIKVTLRTIERDTQQVRQMSVESNFTPE